MTASFDILCWRWNSPIDSGRIETRRGWADMGGKERVVCQHQHSGELVSLCSQRSVLCFALLVHHVMQSERTDGKLVRH